MNLLIADQKQKTKLPSVLRAALKLFNEKGIDGTTIRDIAKAAGVAEGALYRHYKSKDDLAWALFDAHLRHYTEELKKAVLPLPTARERLTTFVEASFRAYDSDPDLYTYLILREHSELKAYPQGAEHPGTFLISLIKEGQAKGEIHVGDPLLLSGLFIGAVIRLGVLKMYGNLTQPLATYSAATAELLWRMLANDAPPEPKAP